MMDGVGPCGFRQHLGAAPHNLRPDPHLLQVSQPPGARMSSAVAVLFTGFLTTWKKTKIRVMSRPWVCVQRGSAGPPHMQGTHLAPPEECGSPQGVPVRLPDTPPSQIARGASRPTRCREPRPGGPGAGSPAAGGGPSPSLGIVAVLCSLGTWALLEGRRLARHKGQQGAAILQGSQRRPLGVLPLCCSPWRAPKKPSLAALLPSLLPSAAHVLLQRWVCWRPSDGTHLGGLCLAGHRMTVFRWWPDRLGNGREAGRGGHRNKMW